jgi:hypothetical protein
LNTSVSTSFMVLYHIKHRRLDVVDCTYKCIWRTQMM